MLIFLCRFSTFIHVFVSVLLPILVNHLPTFSAAVVVTLSSTKATVKRFSLLVAKNGQSNNFKEREIKKRSKELILK